MIIDIISVYFLSLQGPHDIESEQLRPAPACKGSHRKLTKGRPSNIEEYEMRKLLQAVVTGAGALAIGVRSPGRTCWAWLTRALPTI